jgi:hypothetical protein
MICDYCQRPVVTDPVGRCRECGAQHRPRAAERTSPLARIDPLDEKKYAIWGAILGGAGGVVLSSMMFRSKW